jgi:chemotaxis response regulator CheB
VRNAQPDRIRVVLVELTGLTRDVVKGILGEAPDIELVGEVSMRDFSRPDAAAHADVAILAGDGGVLRRRAHELLKARPRLRVLAVAQGGREGSLYELRPHRTPLGELSSRVLLNAVRTGAVAWA